MKLFLALYFWSYSCVALFVLPATLLSEVLFVSGSESVLKILWQLWQHAKWKLTLFSFNLGSCFLSSSMLFMVFYPLSMSVFSLIFLFFFFLQVKFRISCDLNFHLCWWFFTCLYPTLTPQLAALQHFRLRTVTSLASIHHYLHLSCLSTSPFFQSSPHQKPVVYLDSFLSLYTYQVKQ